jgi:diguanylate cyclase (GGDEF)-like protein/PAS domain S-box-containing protein
MEKHQPEIASLRKKVRVLKNALKCVAADALKYRRGLRHALEGIVMLDRQMRITEVNPALAAMAGQTAAELVGKRLQDFYEQGGIDVYSASRRHLSFEALFRAADGRRIPALFNRSDLRNAAGKTIGYMIFVNDLTELKLAQEEFRKAERLYRNMYTKALQGMFQSTLSGEFIRVNPACARILGYGSPKEMLEHKDIAGSLYVDSGDYRHMIETLRKKKALNNYEVKLRRKDGKAVWALASYHLNRDESGRPIVEGILVDHTRQKHLEERLRRSREKFRKLSLIDNLTGLYNTRHLYQELDRLIDDSRVIGKPFALIFIDMDNFKRVVDTYGHLNGSQALREVAHTIRASIRKPSFGVAYGGDEFVVVLPGCDRRRAKAKAEAIHENIKRTVYLESGGLFLRLDASFGLAAFPEDASDRTGLLALADNALFRVKQTGKGAVGMAVSSDQAEG